jgi:hypothetical protein
MKKQSYKRFHRTTVFLHKKTNGMITYGVEHCGKTILSGSYKTNKLDVDYWAELKATIPAVAAMLRVKCRMVEAERSWAIAYRNITDPMFTAPQFKIS